MKKNKVLKILAIIVLLISIEGTAIAAITGVVNVDTVRVRKEPTTESGIVKLVSIGDEITIISKENNWYKVKISGKEGYIRSDLLTIEGDVTLNGETEDNNSSNSNENSNQTEDPNMNTGGDSTEKNPNENTSNNGELSSEITTNNGLQDKTISVIKTYEEVSVGQTIRLQEEVKIKILPLANSSNIEKIQADVQVTILEVMNKWCRIETLDGLSGWIRID